MFRAVPGGVKLAGACLAAALALSAPPAQAAAPQPWWGLTVSSRPTALQPGGHGTVAITAENLGDAASSGEVTIAADLPGGLRATAMEALAGEGSPVCTPETLTCTVDEPILPYETIEVQIAVAVAVEGAGSGARIGASVSGGGAAQPASASDAIEVGAPERFGIESYSLTPEAADGSIQSRAGSHPFQLTSAIALSSAVDGEGTPVPVAAPEQIASALPAGLIADPSQFPQCSQQQLLGGGCPPQSAVGAASVTATGIGGAASNRLATLPVPIYNLTPTPGVAASFAFGFGGIYLFLEAEIRSGGDYGVTISARKITQVATPLSVRMTFWGSPGDPLHDSQRTEGCLLGTEGCTPVTNSSTQPLLSMPTSCGVPFESTATASSWGYPGHPAEEATPVTYRLPQPLNGCESLPFTPSFTMTAESTAASAATGVTVNVKMPQEAGATPEGTVESPIRDLTLTLPEGVALNPAATSWLTGCSEQQVGYLGAGAFTATNPDPFCPGGSQLGHIEIRSPLLSHPLRGALYLATQAANPFSSMVAIYAVAQEPEAGIDVKLAGEVSLNPTTGRPQIRLSDLPQLPFTELSLELAGGPRAPLATPARCGTYAAQATLTPWSGTPAVTLLASMRIVSGAGGGTCPLALSFRPGFAAGMASNQAGASSTLGVQLSRQDGEQVLGGLTLTTPPGLTADMAGVTQCRQAQAAAGACPSSSQIGTVALALGAGPEPAWLGLQGEDPVYLTGPYGGSGACVAGTPGCAPFGLAIVVNPVAGPFDLGEGGPVVVRAKVEVNPVTAQLRIVTGSLPSILRGVPLEVKALTLHIDRSGFLINPTSCEPASIEGLAISGEGGIASVSSRFQAAGCAGLPFRPKVSALTQANGQLEGHGASLHVRIDGAAGQANLRAIKLALPKRLAARLPSIRHACTEGVFARDPAACPAASLVGSARVRTPVLPGGLAGPVYLLAKEGAKAKHDAFPDLVLVLQGDGVHIDLTGSLYVSAKNVTSATFSGLPDIPIGRLELNLPEGRRSILSATGALCRHEGGLRIATLLSGQNGARRAGSSRVRVRGCPPQFRVLKTRVHGARASIFLHVPYAGRLIAHGKGIARKAKRIAKHGGRAAITVRLGRRLRRELRRRRHAHRELRRRRHAHPVKVRVHLRFEARHHTTLRRRVTVRLG